MKRVQKLPEDHGRRRIDSGIKIECKVVCGHGASRNSQQLGIYEHNFLSLEMHRE